jgi:hypothetical protein
MRNVECTLPGQVSVNCASRQPGFTFRFVPPNLTRNASRLLSKIEVHVAARAAQTLRASVLWLDKQDGPARLAREQVLDR